MAENFERHKSTRWVRNSMPSYDAWGDDFSEYDYSPTPAEAAPPEPHNPAADLVLLIDKLRAADSDDDMDSADESDPRVPQAETGSAAPATHTSANHAGRAEAGERQLPHIDAAAANMLAPPTPTFSLFSQMPETPQSEHSFASDADSIQREPDHLNVGSLALGGIQEEPRVKAEKVEKDERQLAVERAADWKLETEQAADWKTEQATERQLATERLLAERLLAGGSAAAPVPGLMPPLESLVLSTDRMNMDSSDDSDHFSFGENDNDDDDWGYNSQHSSNDDEVPEHTEGDDRGSFEHAYYAQTKAEAHPTVKDAPSGAGAAVAKHHIKTDALDSLISDLLKMERRLDMFDNEGYAGTDAANTTGAADSSVGELPSLASIHEFSLPDFHGHSFDELYSRDTAQNILPEVSLSASLVSDDFRVQHERFMTNVLSRTTSIRKPPLFQLPSLAPEIADAHLEAPEFHLEAPESHLEGADSHLEAADAHLDGSETHLGGPSDSDLDRELEARSDSSSISTDNERLAPITSTGSLSTGKMSFDGASVHAAPVDDEISRRASTMSQQTLAFGNWKPNTGMFRDKFVTDNDTESHMNMSIFNNDANYSRFTGLKDDTDSKSVLSVPETVDAYMPSIRESASDEDETPESDKLDSKTSVLKDHEYASPRFEEGGASLEQLQEDTTLESKDLDAANTSNVSGGTTIAESTTSLTKPLRQPYPVFDWKKIMSISQPVDRINALRKAKIDEMAYDTGLNYWLTETLKLSEVSSNIQIGKIASQAYQNAQHSDIRRHTSIRSRVSLVKDKMETGGMQASSLGRKFLSRGKKLMKSSD